MTARAVRTLALTLFALPLFAVVAAADDGPSRLLSAAGPVRPVPTVDRVVAAAAERAALFIVGGLGSDPNDDVAFALLVERFAHDHRIVYFGRDGSVYDSYAAIDANGARLRDFIRLSVKRYDIDEAKVLANSLGGLVSDSAFRTGLRARDGVVAYVSIGSPHRGSTLAAENRMWRGVADLAGAQDEYDEIASTFGHDPAVDAVRDLAERRRPVAPQGVRTTTIAAVNDMVVLGFDSHVEGADQVTMFVLCLEAHGCVLRDERVLDIAEAGLRGEPLPYSPVEKIAAVLARDTLDVPHAGAGLLVGAGVAFTSVVRHFLRTLR